MKSHGSLWLTNDVAGGFLKITNEIPIPIDVLLDDREPSGFVTLAVRLRGNPPVCVPHHR